MSTPGLLDRLLTQPVLMCGLRPFFVLVPASAMFLVALWLALLSGALPGWQPSGGPLAWHAHELLLGFGMAAVAGFLLTAVPEFTGTSGASPARILALVLLWLGARLAYLLSPLVGAVPALLLNLLLGLGLLAQLAPALWRAPERRHLSFVLALAALVLLQLMFFIALLRGQDGLRWLYACTGLMVVLVVLATSRISMRVVNQRIEYGRPVAPPPPLVDYLARPPRRHFATSAVLLACAAEWALGLQPVTGWLALAAAAALFNLLNDWHVGRALLWRYPLMLYASYWLAALGYAGLGAVALGLPWPASAARHLLMVGCLGLSIFAVMGIAGRLHTGHWLERRPWLPLAAALIVLAALLRALVIACPQHTPLLLVLAGLSWMLAFGLYLGHAWPALTGPRSDGGQGCDEPRVNATHAGGGCS